jgi:hypothetical protein
MRSETIIQALQVMKENLDIYIDDLPPDKIYTTTITNYISNKSTNEIVVDRDLLQSTIDSYNIDEV